MVLDIKQEESKGMRRRKVSEKPASVFAGQPTPEVMLQALYCGASENIIFTKLQFHRFQATHYPPFPESMVNGEGLHYHIHIHGIVNKHLDDSISLDLEWFINYLQTLRWFRNVKTIRRMTSLRFRKTEFELVATL